MREQSFRALRGEAYNLRRAGHHLLIVHERDFRERLG